MDTRSEILKRLREYGIEQCHVRTANNIAFSCQKWVIDDALEPRETMFFFFNPASPKDDQWAAREWNKVTGVHGCPCYKPNERWIFVSNPGEVYVLGKGDDNEESPITKMSKFYIFNLKCIAGGYAYAVGPGRTVYKRVEANKWITLHSKLMQNLGSEDYDDIGFEDIDGFSDTDIYACGGKGDLWHFNGKSWLSIKILTNANLERVCCAPDGNVYITTNANLLVIGRNDCWEIFDQNVGNYILEEIVCFNGTIYVSSQEKIFEIKNNLIVETDLALPKMDSYAHLSAGNGILVVAGIHCAYFYNGKSWSQVFDFLSNP